MKINHVLAVGFVVLVLVTAETVFSNVAYGYNEEGTSMFVQDNDFTITKNEDGVSIVTEWTLSGGGFIEDGSYSIFLEFEDGTKTKFSDIKTISGNNGRVNFEIGNNAQWWSQGQISDN